MQDNSDTESSNSSELNHSSSNSSNRSAGFNRLQAVPNRNTPTGMVTGSGSVNPSGM